MDRHAFIKTNRISVIEQLGEINWMAIGSTLSTWKPGTKGYITLHKVGKPKSPEELGYYYGVILPEAFKAFKDNGELDVTVTCRGVSVTMPLSDKTVDVFMKSRYGDWKGEYKDKGDMNMAECALFMDWCILWLGTHFNCQIPPADPNWRQAT